MDQERKIIKRVLAAQHNIDEADSLIRDYFPFIKSEAAKVIGKIPVEGKDDELSIALMGFHEAVEAYDREKGAFLTFASLVIRRRIIDFIRQQDQEIQSVSWEETVKTEEGYERKPVLNEDSVSDITALKWEIVKLTEDLQHLGISMSEVAANCPRYEKVIASCRKVINYLAAQPDKMEVMFETRKLPITEIIQETSVKNKTLEKHRKYLMAMAIIYYRKYDCLIEHLSEVFKSEKGGK